MEAEKITKEQCQETLSFLFQEDDELKNLFSKIVNGDE